MKQIIALAALAFVSGCAVSAEDESIARAEGEATLAAELRDHEPSGPAVSCVSLRDLRGNRSAGEGAIIFDSRGRGLFVNRPAGGCPVLDHGRAISVRSTNNQLCRGEIVQVFDPVNGIGFGSCSLGSFEPYRRRRDG